jgi:hypothetical protein
MKGHRFLVALSTVLTLITLVFANGKVTFCVDANYNKCGNLFVKNEECISFDHEAHWQIIAKQGLSSISIPRGHVCTLYASKDCSIKHKSNGKDFLRLDKSEPDLLKGAFNNMAYSFKCIQQSHMKRNGLSHDINIDGHLPNGEAKDKITSKFTVRGSSDIGSDVSADFGGAIDLCVDTSKHS